MIRNTPGYIRDAYTTNRNFKNIQTSLETQQRINSELMDICKAQQSQINILTTCSKQQAADIEHLEKERKIYTWMIALALLVLSSLLICRYGRKN
jgi:cell division protein FtsL